MYKRRVDLLEPLLAELNPAHYLAVIRQLQYELAEIYSDIAQCKVEVRARVDGVLFSKPHIPSFASFLKAVKTP